MRGGVPPATTPLIALKYEAFPLPFVVSGAPGFVNRSSYVSFIWFTVYTLVFAKHIISLSLRHGGKGYL